MLTECPKCQTIFRVTPAILKMGHGQVRCGKCRTQFDAIECMLEDDELSDEESTSEEEESAEEEAHEESGIEAESPSSEEEITMEGGRIEISGTYRVVPEGEADGSREQVFHEHVVIDRAIPNDDDSESDEPYVDVEFIDDIDPQADPYDDLQRQPASAVGDIDIPTGAETPLAKRFWKRRDTASSWHPNAAQNDIDAELSALAIAPPVVPERTRVWIAVIAVSIVALLAQVVHHYRDPLVRDAKWGGAISRVYHVLGLTLAPNWDLTAYQLQQWGVVSDNSARDVLRIRASVTNAAPFSQPYPHIKLALEDRFGAVVAMREFSPAEYLPSSNSANRMMAPRQRANAEIAIVDPGADAVGFFIDACLPNSGRIVCHGDIRALRK